MADSPAVLSLDVFIVSLLFRGHLLFGSFSSSKINRDISFEGAAVTFRIFWNFVPYCTSAYRCSISVQYGTGTWTFVIARPRRILLNYFYLHSSFGYTCLGVLGVGLVVLLSIARCDGIGFNRRFGGFDGRHLRTSFFHYHRSAPRSTCQRVLPRPFHRLPM